MSYILLRAVDDWAIDELMLGHRRPCSDAYARARDEELIQIFRELRLLRAAGCPPDQTRGNPEVDPWKGRCKSSHHLSTYFVLKAKPSGWRLYFMVPDLVVRRVVFLYAVPKKKNARDQKDFQKLCNLEGKLRSGVAGTVELEIPHR